MHGRWSSQLRCARLQLMHADATCALDFRPVRVVDAPAPAPALEDPAEGAVVGRAVGGGPTKGGAARRSKDKDGGTDWKGGAAKAGFMPERSKNGGASMVSGLATPGIGCAAVAVAVAIAVVVAVVAVVVGGTAAAAAGTAGGTAVDEDAGKAVAPATVGPATTAGGVAPETDVDDSISGTAGTVVVDDGGGGGGGADADMDGRLERSG